MIFDICIIWFKLIVYQSGHITYHIEYVKNYQISDSLVGNIRIVVKHRENRKPLPWEHHIGCQMCQIALSKSTEIFFTVVTAVTVVTLVRKQHLTSSHKKITQLFCLLLFSKYFWKVQLDPFDNRCNVLRAAFCDSPNVFAESLHAFFVCRGCVLFLWRGWMICLVERLPE